MDISNIYNIAKTSTSEYENIVKFKYEILKLYSLIDLDSYSQFYERINSFFTKIEQDILQAQDTHKTIIGFGGGFSAGKSRFINSLLGIDILPEALEPCTALATYIHHSETRQSNAINIFNNKVGISNSELASLRHFVDQDNKANDDGLQMQDIIKRVYVGTPKMLWHNLIFLDTPGYSKADSEYNKYSDEKVALTQLSQADHVVWLVNGKNGTIRNEDLNFLQKIKPKTPIFVVLTQADLISKNDIEPILKSVKKHLDSKGIKYNGVMAWAAPISEVSGKRLFGDDIITWLNQNNDSKPLISNAEKELFKVIEELKSIALKKFYRQEQKLEFFPIYNDIKPLDYIYHPKFYENIHQDIENLITLLYYQFALAYKDNSEKEYHYIIQSYDRGHIPAFKWLCEQSVKSEQVNNFLLSDMEKKDNAHIYYEYALFKYEIGNEFQATEYMAKANIRDPSIKYAYNWLIDKSKNCKHPARQKILEMYESGCVYFSEEPLVYQYYYESILQSNIQALNTVKKKAKENNFEAQRLLATCYTYGYLIEEDYDKAYLLYLKSSEILSSRYNATVMRFLGVGTKRERWEALKTIRENKELRYFREFSNNWKKIFLGIKVPYPIDYDDEQATFPTHYVRVIQIIFIIACIALLIFAYLLPELFLQLIQNIYELIKQQLL